MFHSIVINISRYAIIRELLLVTELILGDR